jgi:heat shock protein HslJ
MRKHVILMSGILLAAILAGCGTKPSGSGRTREISFDEIVDRTWEWAGSIEGESMELSGVPDPANYTIVFQPDGTFSGQADCNFFGGAYEMDGRSLALSMGPSTLAECGGESLHDTFLDMLSRTGSYGERNENLILELTGETGEMVFEEGGLGGLAVVIPQELFNITWMWRDLRKSDSGGRMLVDDVGAYSVTFRENGAVNIQAGCNRVNGSFDIEGERIQIDASPMTMASCGPESRSAEFLELISAAQGFRMEFNELFLELEGNAGTMGFISS